ncbi:MAG: SGNH/GDSL hydrolase family protein [Bernardetiaceae bacterium]
MKNYPKIFRWSLWLLILSGLLASCEPPLEAPTPQAGQADFTRYVALGNSLTAGYSDGAMYRKVQEASYPAQLAQSMQQVGGAAGFKQPLVPEGNGFGGASGRLVLVVTPAGSLAPAATAPDFSVLQPIGSQGPFQNMAVPGAKSFHLLAPQYSSATEGNPFYARFAAQPGQSSMVGETAAQNPTFVTLWIGNNDILGFAASGGESDAITPQQTFDQVMDGILGTLKSANANMGGAIANIPDILAAPYFTTVPWNAFALSADQAAQTNAALQQTALTQGRPLVEAGVEAAVRGQIRTGVEAQARADIRNGVEAQFIETQVRPNVVAGVREQLIALFISEGDSPEVAAQKADFAIQNDPQVLGIIEAETRNAADSLLALDVVQLQLGQAIDSVFNLPSTQAGINAAIDSVFNLPETQAAYNAAIEQQLQLLLAQVPTLQEGPNGFLVATNDRERFPLGVRQAQAGDLICLPALSFVTTAEFQAFPVLPANLLLDTEEQALVNQARAGYNNKITDLARQNNWALVDMDSFFEQIKRGFYYNGISYTTNFVTGNAFSLDGLHLTDRGYALAANRFIEDINRHYNASLPISNVNQYLGLEFP